MENILDANNASLVLITRNEKPNRQVIDHFLLKEFACRDMSEIVIISYKLLHHLDIARRMYGKPMIITSGYRTVSYNKNIGGHPYSHHLTGNAVDLDIPEDYSLEKSLVTTCMTVFPYCRVMTDYIHVDCR